MKSFEAQQQIWNKAGVAGGIPDDLAVVGSVKAGESIQAAINSAAASGGGVVLLEKGVHEVSSSIYLKTGVVVRGVDREEVIVESSIRANAEAGDFISMSEAVWYAKQNATFVMQSYFDDGFKGVQNSGLENLTLDYVLHDMETDPADFNNAPDGKTDMFSSHIRMDWRAENNWIKDVNVYNAGTDPIIIEGNNNTFTGNHVSGSFNKGKEGNGYYNVMGDNNLIQNETVEGIRHFAIQWNAKDNVVVDSDFKVDVNFHNKDAGGNLVEGNTINLPAYHFADPITTGVSRLHVAPGPDNVIFNNETSHGNPRKNDQYDTDTVYSYFGNYGDPRPTDWDAPTGGKFYTADMGNLDTAPVTPPNMAPVVNDDDLATAEDTSLIIKATDVATDPEGGLLTIAVAEGPANGVLVQDGDGALKYTPASDFAGADGAVVVVTDSKGATTKVNVTLEVAARNDAPDAMNDDAGEVVAGEAFTLNSLTQNDRDVEQDKLTITSVDVQTGNFFETLSVDAAGNVVGTLSKDAVGDGAFSYTVSDGKGGTDTATATMIATAPPAPIVTGALTIEEPNLVPEIVISDPVLVSMTQSDVKPTVVTMTLPEPSVTTTVVSSFVETSQMTVTAMPVEPTEIMTVTSSFVPQSTVTVSMSEPAVTPVVVTSSIAEPTLTEVTQTVAPEGPVLAINIGSDEAYTATDGTVFAADTTGVGRRYSTNEEIELTNDDTIYQTEAWGPNGLNYAFDLADGNYEVVLHFAEIWAPAREVGVRIFDIAAEDQIRVDGFDIAESGFRESVLIELDVEVTDGTLNLDFFNDVQNSKLSAIEIWRDDDSDEMNALPMEQDSVLIDHFADDMVI